MGIPKRSQASARQIIEPEFSVERRTSRMDIPPQPDFRLLQVRSAGAVFLVNPNQSLPSPTPHRPTDLLLVRFAPAFLIETAARLRMHRDGSHLLFHHSMTEDGRLGAVLDSIARELDAGEAGWRDVIRSLIHQLAVYLLREHINVQRSDEIELSRVGMVDRRLRRAIEFMHDHCGRELRLAEIAAAAYLSEFHFARLFKKITGVTPHQYLAGLRVERARRLLAETDRTIVEIAAEVGYGTQSHFTKVFREATGLTPLAFRHSLRRADSDSAS
jgi:AraC family transcriptional regulator